MNESNEETKEVRESKSDENDEMTGKRRGRKEIENMKPDKLGNEEAKEVGQNKRD